MGKHENQDKLTKDAVAATNARMSYGKWKAMQGSKNDLPPRPQKSKTPARSSRRSAGFAVKKSRN